MVRKFVLVIFLTTIFLQSSLVSLSANDNLFLYVEIKDEEFLGGDSRFRLQLSENADLNGFGIWDDGKFFISFGRNINIYDKDGVFINCLHLKCASGSPISIMVQGEENLLILFRREKSSVILKRTGEIYDCQKLSDEDFAAIASCFQDIDRSPFKSKKILYEAELKTIEVSLPPIISFPFNNSTHLTVSKTSPSHMILYDDNGTFFIRQFIDLIVVMLVFASLVIVVIVLKKRGAFKRIRARSK